MACFTAPEALNSAKFSACVCLVVALRFVLEERLGQLFYRNRKIDLLRGPDAKRQLTLTMPVVVKDVSRAV